MAEDSGAAEGSENEQDQQPICCSRCSTEVTPGRGEFYIVEIEAKADPTPPVLDDDYLQRDYKSEINALVAELENLEPESRKLTINLCVACYSAWMDNPAGTLDS